MRRLDPRRGRLSAAFALVPLAVALALPGCALVPWRAETAVPAPEARPPDDVVERWRATGKLAARVRDGDGEGGRSWSAAFDWRQRQEDFRLRLSGPFGQGGLEVKGRPGEVELKTAKGERWTARTPEELFGRRIGWDLPASSIRHWITARARPGAPVGDWTLDEDGRLSSLTQQGWRIEYRYPSDSRGPSLPNRITLHGERATVRMVVRDWRLE